MPKSLDDVVKRLKPVEPNRSPNGEYQKFPWAEWFSQDIFCVQQGVDFEGTLEQMGSSIRNKATVLRIKISVVRVEMVGKIYVQVIGRLPEAHLPKLGGRSSKAKPIVIAPSSTATFSQEKVRRAVPSRVQSRKGVPVKKGKK